MPHFPLLSFSLSREHQELPVRVINSDINHKAAYQIAVNYLRYPVLWHDIAGYALLISEPDATVGEDGVLTNMLALQPFLSIYSLKEVPS